MSTDRTPGDRVPQDPEPVDVDCDHCAQPIARGEPYWSVTVFRETLTEDDRVRVQRATVALVYCDVCAPEHDFDAIRVPPRG